MGPELESTLSDAVRDAVAPLGLDLVDACVSDDFGLRVRAASENHPGERLAVYLPWKYVADLAATEFKRMLDERPTPAQFQSMQDDGTVKAVWVPEGGSEA